MFFCDGMNLVVKEYVVMCYDYMGVLVFSEFVGVVYELYEVVLVNFYDMEGFKDVIESVVFMMFEESVCRMEFMCEIVCIVNVVCWVIDFFEEF